MLCSLFMLNQYVIDAVLKYDLCKSIALKILYYCVIFINIFIKKLYKIAVI